MRINCVAILLGKAENITEDIVQSTQPALPLWWRKIHIVVNILKEIFIVILFLTSCDIFVLFLDYKSMVRHLLQVNKYFILACVS